MNNINELLDLDKEKNKEEDSEPVLLTEDQKLKILKMWQESKTPPSIKDLTVAVFGGAYDGRSKRGKLIREYLATQKLEATVSYIYRKKGELELTPEQQEFCANNCQSMTCLEMSETLFGKKLTNLSQETRAVINFTRSLNKQIQYQDPIDIATDDYKAPKIEGSMISRINKYIENPIDEKEYSKNDKQKKAVKALIGYINSYRFLQQINTYETIDDRELFESSFIRYTYDKSDLTPEEADQFILLCSEIVNGKHIQANIEKFQRMANESLDSEEGKRLSMSLVEIISNLRKEHNDCVKRQQSLVNDLKGKRSERLKTKIQENESLVALVEFWKEEDGRRQLLKLAELRKQKLKEEVKRLENLEDIKVQIWGIPTDIINY